MQESRRKDVERLFGVLQGRFHILPSNFHDWNDTEIVHIVETCTILHNMLVRLSLGGELQDEEDESGNPLHPLQIVNEFYYDALAWEVENEQDSTLEANNQNWMELLLGTETVIRNQGAHTKLREALLAHIRARHGNVTIRDN